LVEHIGGTTEAVSITHCAPIAQGKRQAELTDLYSYLPAIGRFLIVVTFLEDALRIITQWGDQLTYLRDFRHSKDDNPQGKTERQE
jgi:hypothetical protein